jgi:polysaccharide export outer membrane protein
MTARFRSKSIANALVTAVALLAAAAPCAAQSKNSKTVAAKENAPVVPTKAAAPAPAAPVVVPAEYIIGSDDVMKVDFWRDKELSSESVTVRPDGKISLPLINELQAAGLTPAQLRDRIVEAAKSYVEDPVVTVEVKAINSRKVFITGEVRKPGPYPLTGTLSVLQLISIAGGLGDYAKGEKITIVRTESGKQSAFKFNYKEVLNQRRLEQNIDLKPGDIVAVP